jgi:hypothetical protein
MTPPDRTDVLITVVAHPPERGRARSLAPAQAGASCCCCCCCLHSLGALIGAAVAPAVGTRRGPATQEEEDYADFPAAAGQPHGASAVRIFWLSVLILGSLVLAGMAVTAVANGPGDVAVGLMVGGIAILMALPALLLAAALATTVVLAVSSRPDKYREFVQLGRITAGVVIGTVVGVIPMACLLFVVTRR